MKTGQTYRICAPGGLATAVAEEREEAERAGASESDWMGKMRNWMYKVKFRMLAHHGRSCEAYDRKGYSIGWGGNRRGRGIWTACV